MILLFVLDCMHHWLFWNALYNLLLWHGLLFVLVFLLMIEEPWNLSLSTSMKHMGLSFSILNGLVCKWEINRGQIICLWRFVHTHKHIYIHHFLSVIVLWMRLLIVSVNPGLQDCWRPKIFQEVEWEADYCFTEGDLSASSRKGAWHNAGLWMLQSYSIFYGSYKKRSIFYGLPLL